MGMQPISTSLNAKGHDHLVTLTRDRKKKKRKYQLNSIHENLVRSRIRTLSALI